jgi:hypothetical protein
VQSGLPGLPTQGGSCLGQALRPFQRQQLTTTATCAGGAGASKLPLSAAGQVQLAFSLCNAHSTLQPYTWDFDALEQDYLLPVADALAPIARVTISSQVRGPLAGSVSAAGAAVGAEGERSGRVFVLRSAIDRRCVRCIASAVGG